MGKAAGEAGPECTYRGKEVGARLLARKLQRYLLPSDDLGSMHSMVAAALHLLNGTLLLVTSIHIKPCRARNSEKRSSHLTDATGVNVAEFENV